MGVAPAKHRGTIPWLRTVALASVALCSLVVGMPATQVNAQSLGVSANPTSRMLLEADTLVYDRDTNVVVAIGSVQIEYDGTHVVADRVTYDRNTAQLTANGNVEIIDSDGRRTTADEFVFSDDFRDGFVNALRVETPEKTYFAAESATRRAGTITTFANGVYTACEPCEEKPDKNPIWRVKARKIIWNGKAKTLRFEHARLEFFGLPLAYLPVLEVPDPTVKRKSGFLVPGIAAGTNLDTASPSPTTWLCRRLTTCSLRAPTTPSRVFLAKPNGASGSILASTASRSPP